MPVRSYNLDSLASALVVMLVITAVTSLVGMLFTPILIIMFLLLVPLVVVFLIWFYRARQNAGHLDSQQRWSPPWAVVGWFVPIYFLWFPYQIMADIWRAGHPVSGRAKFRFLPAAWWACCCLAWFTGLVFGGTVPSLVFAAAAAVLLAFIVKRVSDGPVGSVGKLAVQLPWQTGAPASGQG
jgi:uncharacterized protein DUF4328